MKTYLIKVVPTGNFGNIFAAYAAKQMGLPIDRMVVATNQNDILSRFLASGEMKLEGVQPSISPSMDIQVSSNFERYLFDLFDRDGSAVTEALAPSSPGAPRATTSPQQSVP